MFSFINPLHLVRINSKFYRFRFIIFYTLFGFISIIIEFLIRSYLIEANIHYRSATFIAITSGIFFAFWLNVTFNYKIPNSRRNISFVYFVLISYSSAAIQFFINYSTGNFFNSYELGRIFISGSCFIFGYALHRYTSFKDFTKVGVAIYANGIEDIDSIYSKITTYPDFIHLDVVDKTMSKSAEDVKSYKIETVRAYWPSHEIQTHIMSFYPSKWLDEFLEKSDVIYLHVEIKENIITLLKKIKSRGKKTGIAIFMQTELSEIKNLFSEVDSVLLLTIPHPGQSGQKFDFDALEKIKFINQLPNRKDFSLCIDGGINENTIKHIDSEFIVSGSSVLSSKNPQKKIMYLQASGRYEAL